MENISSAKSCNSKQILRDLLIIATVFVALSAFSSAALAVPGYNWVWVADYKEANIYRNVLGNQTTLQFTVYEGEASYVSLHYNDNNWFQLGFLKGYDYYGNWHDTPTFYVDRSLNSLLTEWVFEETPVGQNHEYRVFIYTGNGLNIMYALVDGTLKKSENGYPPGGYVARGATETHDTSDVMNSHFFDMKAGEQWLTYSPFHNDSWHFVFPHYFLRPIPPTTEWWATGGGY